MSKQTYRVCFCFRRKFRLAVSEAPEEIKRVFEQYAEKGIMSVDGLQRFLVEVQKEDKATREDAQKIIDSVKHFHRKGLNLEAFFKYLFGDLNSPLASLGVHHDMSAPLSHYFIYTGHNSYLTGNQLKNDSQRGKASDEEAWGKEVLDLKGSHIADSKNDLDEEDEEDLEDVDKSQHNLAPEYKRLIAIHAGKPKGGLDEWLKVDPDKVRRLSMSEQQLEKAAETHGKQIVRFTQQNILRVYPKGIRVDSSNYNPLIGWMHGAQMVAFNMQGYGRSLWLMHGMFKANGGCGYVKKPDFLLNSNEVFDPKVKLPVKKILKMTVYMGEGWYYDFHHTHFDAYSPPDFYARIGIAGVPADSVMKKTKTLEDNWVPSWNEEFEFPLTVPELALLRIEVHEYDMSEKDDFGGQTCLPISELRSGIRAVCLNSRKGDKYNSVKLLMRFEFITP
ncbi:hypothetical protein DITRI_Ditri09bG0151400 [Diplodiscus trichospermus]